MRLQPLRMRCITWPMRRGANFSHIFEVPDPDLPIHYTTFMALRLRQMELSAKTAYSPVLKITQLSAHAQNHVSIERCHIFIAHAQKQLFMNFRIKLWHHNSSHWPRFPYRARYFRDLRTFSVDFCIEQVECPPYFYFRCSWPTDRERVLRDATSRRKLLPRLKLIRPSVAEL